jgi:hypothetical protein
MPDNSQGVPTAGLICILVGLGLGLVLAGGIMGAHYTKRRLSRHQQDIWHGQRGMELRQFPSPPGTINSRNTARAGTPTPDYAWQRQHFDRLYPPSVHTV